MVDMLTTPGAFEVPEGEGIVQIEKKIKKNWRGILSCCSPSKEVLERVRNDHFCLLQLQMNKEVRVNCLKKGDLQPKTGKKIYMLCVDGTPSSMKVIEWAASPLHIESTDHVILCCAYNTYVKVLHFAHSVVINTLTIETPTRSSITKLGKPRVALLEQLKRN